LVAREGPGAHYREGPRLPCLRVGEAWAFWGGYARVRAKGEELKTPFWTGLSEGLGKGARDTPSPCPWPVATGATPWPSRGLAGGGRGSA